MTDSILVFGKLFNKGRSAWHNSVIEIHFDVMERLKLLEKQVSKAYPAINIHELSGEHVAKAIELTAIRFSSTDRITLAEYWRQ